MKGGVCGRCVPRIRHGGKATPVSQERGRVAGDWWLRTRSGDYAHSG
jgi:hypothetical protein